MIKDIQHTQEFIGGRLQFAALMNYLNKPSLGGLLYLGLRGIGKSTLLREISELAAKRSELFGSFVISTIPVDFDSSNKYGLMTWDELLANVQSGLPPDYDFEKKFAIRAKVSEGLSKLQNSKANDNTEHPIKIMESFFGQLAEVDENLRILFLVDDFDKWNPGSNRWQDIDLNQISLMIPIKLAKLNNVGVIVTAENENLLAGIEGYSNFVQRDDYNPCWLPRFNSEETTQLIATMTPGFARELTEGVYNLTGGYPLLSKQISQILVEKYSRKANRLYVNPWLQEEAKEWFNSIWPVLTPDMRYALNDLARRQQHESTQVSVLNRLRDLQLVNLEEPDNKDNSKPRAELAFEALRPLILGETTAAGSSHPIWYRFSYTGERFMILGLFTLFASFLTMIIFSIIGLDPIWAALWLLLPSIYAIYGLFYIRRNHGPRSFSA